MNNNEIMIMIVKIIIMINANLLGWHISIKSDKKISLYKKLTDFSQDELETFDVNNFVDNLLIVKN